MLKKIYLLQLLTIFSIYSKYTAITVISGANDLFAFAGRNINQMLQVGSNEHVNIVVHLDMHKPGHSKFSKRYLIKKNDLEEYDTEFAMDSGDPDTLIDACKWAIESFPADDHILFLWNHGTGALEPSFKNTINPSNLFFYNPETKLIELNRKIGFFEYIDEMSMKNTKRGICFDYTTGNYLTNKQLNKSLKHIREKHMHNKKFAIVGFDACLMAAVEVCFEIKDHAHLMVASCEVELGTGWNYAEVFKPFEHRYLTKEDCAKNIVEVFRKTYNNITHDYTQSAINLDKFYYLEKNITDLSSLLIFGLENQKNNSLKRIIKKSKHKKNCTHFDEPTYKCLSDLCTNILNQIEECELEENSEEFQEQLKLTLESTIKTINKIVIANTAGPNLSRAKGLSIYFPENHIHKSYEQCDFAITTGWLKFLKTYLEV